jgi:hypothetical protein
LGSFKGSVPSFQKAADLLKASEREVSYMRQETQQETKEIEEMPNENE